ncbi:MAG: 50S ribosomal protein L3 [Deltaproteobacteria bacterium]|nr:50S ribosomal protein L3 [Deltaproteobacteria bacterium]
MNGLIGKKLGMSQIFAADGTLIPVTVIQAGPCTIVQKKNTHRDGYTAIQVGFGTRKIQRASKALVGHCKKANASPFAVLREFDTDDIDKYEIGAEINVATLFAAGEKVDVIGTTKGRGFAGVIKRHGMAGFPGSRGTHEYFRHGGSIGNRSFPGRIFKGKRMAGQHGNTRVTTTQLRVVEVRGEDNLIFIRGAVPGASGGVVIIRKATVGKK